MILFGGFDYNEIIKAIDSLVFQRKYGSFTELENWTVRELINILNMIENKEREKELSSAQAIGGGEKATELTPEMKRALEAKPKF